MAAEPSTIKVKPIATRNGIPTIKWVSRETKGKVEKVVMDEQAGSLSDFKASKESESVYNSIFVCTFVSAAFSMCVGIRLPTIRS